MEGRRWGSCREIRQMVVNLDIVAGERSNSIHNNHGHNLSFSVFVHPYSVAIAQE